MEPTASQKRHRNIVVIGLVGGVMFVGLSIASIALYNGVFGRGSVGSGGYGRYGGACNVAGIMMHGDMYTYVSSGSWSEPDAFGNQEVEGDMVASEDIVAMIEDAAADPSIQAIMLEIDSYGGSPVAGEEVATALREAGKPTVAVIRQGGTSAAYWAATGAEHIVASRNSDVGSIGVTMSYLENIAPGTKYIELASGEFKDAGSPDKPLTAAERALLMRDVQITHENFVQAVADNRGLSLEKVREIADGSTVLGQAALDLGLIDQLGSWNEAKSYLASRIAAEPIVCW